MQKAKMFTKGHLQKGTHLNSKFLVFPHHQSPAIGVVTRIGALDIFIPPPRQEP